ncbi:MAG TPA: UDP-N-acetylglucosamine 1-carboxyvinyltransferase [Candidatus Eisenbacteria bacterium]
MQKLSIQGGVPLSGEIRVSGAKNAALPILAAALLAESPARVSNLPRLKDVETMLALLERMGVGVSRQDGAAELDARRIAEPFAPYELVKTMRASIYVLGPLLARYGEARVSLPGGCAWGPRPVDLHIKGMEALGAEIEIDHGYIVARAPHGLRGGTISFDISSVGATGNILMAAATAAGRTTIENAACEPEIEALANFLVTMGAQIEGIGTPRLVVNGVPELHPADAPMIPDRIEAGTLLVAAAITGGDVEVTGVDPAHLGAVINKLEAAGSSLETSDTAVRLRASGRPEPINVTTKPYPGFPTDMQAQFMALLSVARGACTIEDTVYHDRFTHVAELQRLGADIRIGGNTAFVQGVESLSGAPVMATDLRASAALILAGLVAGGETRVTRVYHLDRGYERLEAKLASLGAIVRRVRP